MQFCACAGTGREGLVVGVGVQLYMRFCGTFIDFEALWLV